MARTAADVVGVFTASDFPTGPMPPFLWDAPPQALIDKLNPRMRSSSPPPIANDQAKYVGQIVAVIVARTRLAAEDAAELIDRIEHFQSAIHARDQIHNFETDGFILGIESAVSG